MTSAEQRVRPRPQENLVDNDPAPPTPAEDPDTPVSTTIERQLRRLPTVLLNAAAVLSTTVMAVAIDPKKPPFRGY
jgi:hypothetical protein